MRTILTTLCFLIASMTAPFAFQVVEQFTPDNVDSVRVNIKDGAKEGCWTNLGEVKRYAEDKLEIAGYAVASKDMQRTAKSFELAISVNSGRGVANGCYGSVAFQIYTPRWVDGMYGHFVVGSGGAVFSGQINTNQLVLEYLQGFFDAFPK